MKRWLKFLVPGVLAGFFAIAIAMIDRAAADDAAKPLAVWFYADWCTNCKILAPKYAPARSGLEDRIQFVTLDVTDDAAREKAKATATTLGIGPLYFSNHATGWVALLDAKRNKVGELHSDESTDDMRSALDKLAQGV